MEEKELVKISPDRWYELAVLLTSAESVLPIFSDSYTAPDKVDKAIELNVAVNVLFKFMDELSDDIDYSGGEDSNHMFNRYFKEITDLASYAMPLLSKEAQEAVKEEQKVLSKQLTEYFENRAKEVLTDDSVHMGISQEQIDKELEDLTSKFDDKVDKALQGGILDGTEN